MLTFSDPEHFVAEVEQNLRHGRAFARSERAVQLNERLRLQLSAPGTDQLLTLGAVAVFVQGDLLGLQLTDLDDARRSQLERMVAKVLGRDAESASTTDDVDASPDLREVGPATTDLPDDEETVAEAHTSSPASSLLRADPKVGARSSDPSPAPSQDLPVVPALRTVEGSEKAGFDLSPSGRLRVEHPALLLSLYLQALKGDRLLVSGGYGQPGDVVHLEVELERHAQTMDARILERREDFTAIQIPDPSPLADLLPRFTDRLLPILEPIGLATPSTQDLDPTSSAESPRGARGTTEDDRAPPQVPRLEGEIVRFQRMKDLRHELDVNVKNGGLFVESEPMELRQRVELRFVVGSMPVGRPLSADVVFSNAGRVGFSFVEPQRAYVLLSESLAQVAKAADTADLQAPRKPTDDIPSFSGKLQPPLPIERLVQLERHRLSNPHQLSETSMIQLFEFVARHRWTGVLDVSTERERRSIFFHQGDVAFVQATPFDEGSSLGRLLVVQKRVNEAHLREALERSKGSHRLLGKMLVLLGFIKRGELIGALREQTRLKVGSSFQWSSGEYRWSPWREPPGDADLVITKSLSVLARYIRGVLESMSSGDVDRLLSGSMQNVLVHQNLEHQASQLLLQPKELRFLELQVDGQKTVHDTITGSPLGRLGSQRLLLECVALGALTFKDAEATVASKPNAAAKQWSELNQELDRLRAANHFEVLGVHWSSHHRTYEDAWTRAKNAYADDDYRNAGTETKDLVRQLRARIDEAYEAVKDTGSRATYRRQLFDRTERQYAAEMLVRQGEVALLRGDRMQAIEALETAVELDPNPRTRHLLASAREGGRH